MSAVGAAVASGRSREGLRPGFCVGDHDGERCFVDVDVANVLDTTAERLTPSRNDRCHPSPTAADNTTCASSSTKRPAQPPRGLSDGSRSSARATIVRVGASPEQSFLQRPLAVVSLVGGVLGIVVAGLALVTGIFGPLRSPDSGSDVRPKVEMCMRSHGLSQATEKKTFEEGRVLFRACSWPPPQGAGTDGFSEITLASSNGPGESEAEGLTVADVYTTECRDIEVVYLFDNQGTFVVEQSLRLTKGEVRRVEGGSVWQPRSEDEAAIFQPRRDEFIVMSNSRYIPDSARCI